MSKGKDFRGPRKRGFDDDGPYNYEFPATQQPVAANTLRRGRISRGAAHVLERSPRSTPW